jgi:hypothetical protein
MMTELPSGGSTRLMDVLRKLKWPVTVAPIGSGVWGSWEFPKQLWDVDNQRWKSPYSKIKTWLDELISECEEDDQPSISNRRHFLNTR